LNFKSVIAFLDNLDAVYFSPNTAEKDPNLTV
jgi:hypothetical protein